MLGPNDIDDWLVDEDDRLRAEIRLLPVVQRYRRDPRSAVKGLDRSLATRLSRFCENADMPIGQLGALLDDLRARGPEG